LKTFTEPSQQEQHINSVAYSDKAGQLLIGGPDGYAVVLSPSDPSSALELKGHVGDVLHVSWFPSGEVVLTASSDLTLRIFSSKTGINPRTLKGHTRAITSTAILGVGKQVLSASKDGTLRVWDVGAGTEARRWAVGGSVEALVVVEDEVGLAALGQGAGQRVALAATPEGSISAYVLESESAAPLFTVSPAVSSSKLLSIAYDPASQLVASGHADGKIVLRRLAALAGDNSDAVVVRRNVAPIFSLAFAGTDLLVGTGSGLPCRLAIDADLNATVKEEYAGWEAVAIESWAVAPDGVWCAGGEKSVRRY
jgi:proteasomal ATPase-associated factor 1